MRERRNRDRSQLALDLEPRDPTLFSATPNVKGLIEALADLLLEAMGERTTALDAVARQGGADERRALDSASSSAGPSPVRNASATALSIRAARISWQVGKPSLERR